MFCIGQINVFFYYNNFFDVNLVLMDLLKRNFVSWRNIFAWLKFIESRLKVKDFKKCSIEITNISISTPQFHFTLKYLLNIFDIKCFAQRYDSSLFYTKKLLEILKMAKSYLPKIPISKKEHIDTELIPIKKNENFQKGPN